MVSLKTVNAVCQDALVYKAASAAVPCKDTCKIVDSKGFVQTTPDRKSLMTIQTPQAFERKLYINSIKYANSMGAVYTDDCQLVEAMGRQVKLTQGEYKNFKLTTQEDLVSARAMAKWMGERRHANRYRLRRTQAR